MPIAMIEYVEVNITGVALLLVMLFYIKLKHIAYQSEECKPFMWMLRLNALILLFDSGIYILRGHGEAGWLALSHCLCVGFFSMHAWFGYAWLRFVLRKLRARKKPTRLKALACALPAVISTLFTLCSPFTGWVYSLSAKNVYSRGPYLLVSFIVSIIYIALSAALIAREWRHPACSRETGEYISLLAIPLPLILGNLLQLWFYGLSIVWIFATISMLILFIDIMHGQLSRDILTGLYNRRQMNIQLLWELKHARGSGYLLFVAMIDVDHFKRINDLYGHLSGDKALAAVGKILHDNCRAGDFVSRFGGDEFFIICRIGSAQSAGKIVRRINLALDKFNQSRQLPYSLAVSIGHLVLSPGDGATLDYVLDEADKRMYAVKREKYAAH